MEPGLKAYRLKKGMKMSVQTPDGIKHAVGGDVVHLNASQAQSFRDKFEPIVGDVPATPTSKLTHPPLKDGPPTHRAASDDDDDDDEEEVDEVDEEDDEEDSDEEIPEDKKDLPPGHPDESPIAKRRREKAEKKAAKKAAKDAKNRK